MLRSWFRVSGWKYVGWTAWVSVITIGIMANASTSDFQRAAVYFWFAVISYGSYRAFRIVWPKCVRWNRRIKKSRAQTNEEQMRIWDDLYRQRLAENPIYQVPRENFREAKNSHAGKEGELHTVDPADFEQIVAGLLVRIGYRKVRRTGKAGDLMADITATAPDGRSTIVQCKRYGPDVQIGSPVVQSFIGMVHVHHQAQIGMFVTTGRFSGPAKDLANRHGIRLIDGVELKNLLDWDRKPETVPR